MKQAKSNSVLVDISYLDYLEERRTRKKLGNGKMVSTFDLTPPRPPPPTSSPPWVNLPREITAMIIQKLGSVEILFSARRVCTTWRNICKDPAMWRVVDIIFDNDDEDEDEDVDDDEDVDMDVYEDERFKVKKVKKGSRCAVDRNQLRKLCRQAVDLSQGELIDIEVECDHQVLDYIAQRSPKLRRLHLHGDCDDCEVVISDAVKKFPLLEEMHYIYHSIYDQTIQTIIDIGRSCPLMTSFSLNAHGYQGYRREHESNRLAFAVSSMSKLQHLQIFNCYMSNIGLTAILDGCTQLESLDLRKCINLKLDGKLGQRCFKKIKHLRLPNDSIKDYPKYHRLEDEFNYKESESESEEEYEEDEDEDEDESEEEEEEEEKEEEEEDKYKNKEKGKDDKLKEEEEDVTFEDDNSFLPYANYDEYFAAEKKRLEEEMEEEDEIWSD